MNFLLQMAGLCPAILLFPSPARYRDLSPHRHPAQAGIM